MSSDAVFDYIMAKESYMPTDGSALNYFFNHVPPLPDEFLVKMAPYLVLTNLRLLIKNGEPKAWTEISMPDVVSCDLSETKQLKISFTMRSGETIALSNIEGFVIDLDKQVEQGLFTR
jgi:hypothetical protein